MTHCWIQKKKKWQSDRNYENTEVLKPGKRRRRRTKIKTKHQTDDQLLHLLPVFG